METIKTSPNVEFDVIYADGTRKRVHEGVLLEAESNGEMILHNGTDRPAVWIAATETMLMALHACGDGLKALAMGMLVTKETFATLLAFAEYAATSLYIDLPGTFRLGQMDFQLCGDYEELKQTLDHINRHGYDLITVTQDGRGFYTVFFRRRACG